MVQEASFGNASISVEIVVLGMNQRLHWTTWHVSENLIIFLPLPVPVDEGSQAFLRFSTVNLTTLTDIINETETIPLQILELELTQVVCEATFMCTVSDNYYIERYSQ